MNPSNTQKRLISKDLYDLDTVAESLFNFCKYEKIFAFYGDLGVGKTTLLQHLCKQLHVDDKIVSPTFTIINEYEGDDKVFHMDFFRINALEEALDIGILDYFESGNYIFIEWPSKIEKLLPEETVRVYIETREQGERDILIKKA